MDQDQAKLTPMLRQYMRIKEEHPDALLFFRMGDFYELFFQDAEIAARELQIALTSRNHDRDNGVPMCGVPYHSVQEYLRQLLEKRHKIAICEQMEDPAKAKGLVERAVTRILTPGTVVEDNSLQAKVHNYLSAFLYDRSKGQGGLAWIDFSTGDWSGLAAKSPEQLWQWAEKVQPREILCPEGIEIPERFTDLQDRITWLPFASYFDYRRARAGVLEHQGTNSLEPLDLEDKPQLVQACGALLTYLRQTQKQDLAHIGAFRPINLSKYLILDEVTERNLELFRRLDGSKGPGTLWHVLDHTQTPMGGRLLQHRIKHPWRDKGPIRAQQEAVAFFVQREDLHQEIERGLDSVYDLERLSTRIFLNRCTPKDFIALRNSLSRLPAVRDSLQRGAGEGGHPERMRELLHRWDDLNDVLSLLEQSLVESPPTLITEGGLFKPGFDHDLDELLELAEHGEAKLRELLQREQREHELPKLKLGFNRVFGYYFELSRAHKGKVPEHFHRRQTLVNSERYLTDELKELEEKLFSAAEKRKSLEYDLFQELRRQVGEARERIASMAGIIAELDYWQALARASGAWGWSRPEVHSGLDIRIEEGRHPAVEAAQGRADYIPNDLLLDESGRILLITGPNMAGKSTVLRQAAIICILAQIGSFVPAREASIGLCDRIFTRVGASDNLAFGQSTFMVEMIETARILRQAGKRSLVVLDEIGRGTSTFDGLSLAWAVVENLASKGKGGIRTLFATHYHELTDLEGKIPGIRNYNIAVREWKGDIVFLRRMVPGPADRSYGIEVARLAGIPQPVTQRAKEILAQLERKSEKLKLSGAERRKPSQSLLPGLLAREGQEGQEGRQERQPRPDPQDHPLLQELQDVDPDNMTPMQALNILSDWKHRWNSGGKKNE